MMARYAAMVRRMRCRSMVGSMRNGPVVIHIEIDPMVIAVQVNGMMAARVSPMACSEKRQDEDAQDADCK